MIEQVKGTQNITGDNALKYLHIQNLFNKKFSNYGYQYIQTPLLEYKELFDKSIGESSEIVTKQMYELIDKGGRELVLRPEGTSSIVRYHAEFNKDLTKKYSYFGSMFRYENPQKNRYREFNQAGVEIVGLVDIFSDFQIINDSFNFINELIPNTKLSINTIGSISDREEYIKILYEYFQKNIDKLSKDSIDKLENNTLRILDSNSPDDSEVISKAPNISELKVILKDLLNLAENKVNIDQIQTSVCQFFKINKTEMLSARRSRYLVRPRQTAIYLSKMLTSKSLPEIGRVLLFSITPWQ